MRLKKHKGEQDQKIDIFENYKNCFEKIESNYGDNESLRSKKHEISIVKQKKDIFKLSWW